MGILQSEEFEEYIINEYMHVIVYNDGGEPRTQIYVLDRSRSMPSIGKEYWVAVNLSQDSIPHMIEILKGNQKIEDTK